MVFFPRLVRHEGNASLFSAIEISVISSYTGLPLHVHVEGLRGTGKTSIMRAARDILPPIVRIKGCKYNCHPSAPHCPEHAGRPSEYIRKLGREMVPMPFLEIHHSAKLGTVVGSIDLAKLTDSSSPSAALMPGTIPQAHRGIIFVDEVNRLAETAPEITDVLLSVMGTKPGVVKVEETGLPPVELPVSVSVWAASNPDEDPGALEDIRRQLADRFDLVVAMARPQTLEAVVKVLETRSANQFAGPGAPGYAAFMAKALELHEARESPSFAEAGDELECYREKLAGAASLLPEIEVSPEILELIARLYLDFGLESLRAVEAIKISATCHAALAGRQYVAVDDLRAVVPLALRHRADPGTISKVLETLRSMEVATKLSQGSTAAASSVAGYASLSCQVRKPEGGQGKFSARAQRDLSCDSRPRRTPALRDGQMPREQGHETRSMAQDSNVAGEAGGGPQAGTDGAAPACASGTGSSIVGTRAGGGSSRLLQYLKQLFCRTVPDRPAGFRPATDHDASPEPGREPGAAGSPRGEPGAGGAGTSAAGDAAEGAQRECHGNPSPVKPVPAEEAPLIAPPGIGRPLREIPLEEAVTPASAEGGQGSA